MKLLIFALTFAVCLYGASAFWWPCATGGREPDDVTSPHCDADRCWAVRGEPLTARVYLTGHDVHHELMVRAFVWIGGVRIPLPSTPPHDNGCNSLFIGDVQQFCPTRPFVQYVWVVNEIVPENIPAFQNSQLQYQLWDRGVEIGCVNLIATVV